MYDQENLFGYVNKKSNGPCLSYKQHRVMDQLVNFREDLMEHLRKI